ncbi:MAG TPA: NADH:flavin oxidoreductase/NADH oxidase, partial [Propionibacteriaceae bacterium]|nr:NADH:flavin oxidoreductase/NADH oxidase [Propionibacteriaceae bacterium]
VDWHLVHYGSFAQGGFGLIVAEATAVVPEGRISPFDCGLWNDDQTEAWSRITRFAHSQKAAMGVQLGHAGRKASTAPWLPGAVDGNVSAVNGGWTPVGPTTERFGQDIYTSEVHALTVPEIGDIVQAFADAARRADDAGFDTVEVHAAHGYLMHEFYSPLSNTRTDSYGGDFAGRTRILREVVDAIRAVWPERKPLLVRLSASDWHPDGWTIDDSVTLCLDLKERGVDLIDVSSGGNQIVPIPAGPGYQVHFAEQIRREVGIPTATVGIITQPDEAEAIIAEGRADAVMIGRQALREPTWPLRAAAELGVPTADSPYPGPRWRGAWRPVVKQT